MFDRYINKPKETKESFTEDGWFKTGDCAIGNLCISHGIVNPIELEDKATGKKTVTGVFKHLGRLSQDIIKKGGYKLSALEIEGGILEFA